MNLKDFDRPGRRHLLKAALACTWPAALASGAHAATWPEKAVKLVVGFPPSSSPDALARLIAEPLGHALGQPVIVDNKVGATGTIGVNAVATATDGHTIGLTGNGPLTTARLFNPKLPYDVARDLSPIALVASSPFVLVGKSGLPAQLEAMVAYAKAQGNRLTYGSIGVGSGSHLTMELFKHLTGIQPVHVPFPGFPQVVMAILGGLVDLGFMVPSIAVSQVKTGRLRMYGISTASRSAALPEVAPIAQTLNLPRFDISSWNALFGPASMPAATTARVAAEVSRIVKSDDIRQSLFDQGWQALGTSPEAMSRQISEDRARWSEVVRLTGVRGE